MKKFLSFLIILICVVTFTGCNNNNSGGSVTQKICAPKITYDDRVVSWSAIENARGYVLSINGKESGMQTDTSYIFDENMSGDFEVKVKTIAFDSEKYQDSDWSNVITFHIETIELDNIKIFVVGDSTACAFNDKYFYPRYGYGTQLANYFKNKVTVRNLAISGRSSLSYLSETNYETLQEELGAGDYLFIAFGHNDENSADSSKYTKPTLNAKDIDKTDGVYNFQYILNENYIKLAVEKGATPILFTPIVRLNINNNYSGDSGHITDDGDYADCIVNLGENTNTAVINLRDITKQDYISLGYDQAKYFHAVISGLSQTEPNWNSVDKTHINIYGAKYIAYKIANILRTNHTGLRLYVRNDITPPSRDENLVVNPEYIYTDYSPVDWSKYDAVDRFATTSDGWYGTAFGDCGGNPTGSSSAYVAKEKDNGVFEVGSTNTTKGKFTNSSDGFAFVFKQIDIEEDFTITAEATVLADGVNQAGFGLMLRDDCYTPTNNPSVKGNYIAAGIIAETSSQVAIFSRSSETSLTKSNNSIAGLYKAGDTAILMIEKTGDAIKCTAEYDGETYEKTYTNFALDDKDTAYMYVGMFATRGTTVEFTDVVYTKK